MSLPPIIAELLPGADLVAPILPRPPVPVPLDLVNDPAVWPDISFPAGQTPYDQTSYQRYGPFEYKKNLWAFPLAEDSDAIDPVYDDDGNQIQPDLKAGIYKSTDRGNTWVRQDQAHAPLIVMQYGQNFFWDGAGPIVTVVTVTRTPDFSGETVVSLTDFNLDTGLFGAPYGVRDFHTAPPPSGGQRIFTPQIFRLSSGIIRFVYNHLTNDGNLGTDCRVKYADYDPLAATWGAPVPLPHQTDALMHVGLCRSVVQDGDLLHVIYVTHTQNYDGAVRYVEDSDQWWYLAILADGTFTAPLDLNPLLHTPDAPGTVELIGDVKHGIVSGDWLLIPAWRTEITLDAEDSETDYRQTLGVLRAHNAHGPAAGFAYAVVETRRANFGFGDVALLHLPAKDVMTWNGPQFLQSESGDQGNAWTEPRLWFDVSRAGTPPPFSTPNARQYGEDTTLFTLSTGMVSNAPALMFTTWTVYAMPLPLVSRRGGAIFGTLAGFFPPPAVGGGA
jgi:hypothetical protein